MSEEKKTRSEAKEWILSIVIAVALAFIIKIFLFDFVVVQGSSMYPTLKDGDRLVLNKIEYRLSDPDYGDIVVLNHDAKSEWVKRVIGKGGDTIEIRDQVVYRNGEPLDEPYINPEPYGDFSQVTVPEGCYFVMGDNRANSSDSRFTSLGFVERDQIVGHVVFRFWPLDSIGGISNGE